MFVDDQTYKRNGKTYRRVLLRSCVRDPQTKRPRNVTIANLSGASDLEIEAIKFALKQAKSKDPGALMSIQDVRHETGKSVGGVAALAQIAERLGITSALGRSEEASLVMVMVLSRLLGLRSRTASVRGANIFALREVTGADAFDENRLYVAMDWLYENQSRIEKRLFKRRKVKKTVFLYDLSSSYLEGQHNELAAYGYSRDKKRGKKQITYGLLCDEDGIPVSVQAFEGNMHDNKTVAQQVEKLKTRFGCTHVTFVGDKGMIRSSEIQTLQRNGFNYISSISKAEIRTLEKRGVIQYELFDEELVDIQDPEKGCRYIIRRNPYLQKEQKAHREELMELMRSKVEQSNQYLEEHPRARVKTQMNRLNKLIAKFGMKKYCSLLEEDRKIDVVFDRQEVEHLELLDGCFAIKTDLSEDVADKQTVFNRYKDLASVEWAFRTEKTDLNIRPVFVRKKERTQAHLFVVMLAYMIEQELRRRWKDMELTVMEGIQTLNTITSIKWVHDDTPINITINGPNPIHKSLLDAAGVILPTALPWKESKVLTKTSLAKQRK